MSKTDSPRWFDRKLYLNLFRRGFLTLDTGCFTRDMARWYFSTGFERYGWQDRKRDFSIVAHVPGAVFVLNFRVSRVAR